MDPRSKLKEKMARRAKKIRRPDNGRDAQMIELMGIVDSAVDIIMEGELTLNQAQRLLDEIQETTESDLPEVVPEYLQILENRLKPLLDRYTIKDAAPEPPSEESEDDGEGEGEGEGEEPS